MTFAMRDKEALDKAVLAYLGNPDKCNGGASYWAIADGLNEAEGNVTSSLRRLKTRSVVCFNGLKRRWELVAK